MTMPKVLSSILELFCEHRLISNCVFEVATLFPKSGLWESSLSQLPFSLMNSCRVWLLHIFLIKSLHLHCCHSGSSHQYVWNLLLQFLVPLLIMPSASAFSIQYSVASVKILHCVPPLLQFMLSLPITLRTKFKLPYYSFIYPPNIR